MTEKRLIVFKILAILLPLAFLALLEIGLRMFGYGHDLSLFVKDPNHKGYLVMNQYASEKYFSNQKNATIGNFEPFTEKKSPGTFRIFVLGESTTIGYPYMNNGSFHRWLQYRLMHTFPERDFEVINLSLTAVNSHTVLDFAKGILQYEPDAVLVYTGHNEYYGALGAAVTGRFSNPILLRFLMRAREFRFVQLLSAGISNIAETVSGERVDLRENLMKRMAADQQIPSQSEQYKQGIAQFRGNMHALGKLLSARRVPLLLSNLVSNEKDLKPLVSLPGGTGVSANLHYRQGQDLYQCGKFSEAKKEFITAKQLDVLRFRAPEEMNKIIQEVATQYNGVTLIDTKKLFETNSPQHILGKETLLEHVHPNLNGYALLAEGFYEGMKKNGMIPNKSPREMTFATLKKRMPVTRVDSLKGEYEIMILKEGWPFNIPMPAEEKREKTLEEQLAGALVVKQLIWPDAMGRLQKYLIAKKDTAGALRVTEAMLLENPLDVSLYDQAAKWSLMRNDNETAVTYLSHAFRKENSFESARQLFITLLKLDRPEEALPYLSFAAANNTSQFSYNELRGFVQQLVKVRGTFQRDTANVMLSNQLAACYLQFANTAAASKYIKKSLALEPGNPIALKMQQQIRGIEN